MQHQVGKSYPSIEVEWLAATTFNHGIDLYISKRMESFETWMRRAIELAEFLDDGGAFKTTLTEKLDRLLQSTA